MKWDLRLVLLAGCFNGNLDSLRVLLLSHRKRIGVDENLRCSRAHPAPENEPQHHRQEFGVEVLGIVD